MRFILTHIILTKTSLLQGSQLSLQAAGLGHQQELGAGIHLGGNSSAPTDCTVLRQIFSRDGICFLARNPNLHMHV